MEGFLEENVVISLGAEKSRPGTKPSKHFFLSTTSRLPENVGNTLYTFQCYWTKLGLNLSQHLVNFS